MPVIAEGAIFKIVAEANVVTCSVVNRSDVTPEEGARCAQEMRDVLIGHVVSRGSRYVGLVFDVSAGPAVFGPKTRASLEELFHTAEAHHKRVAVRVSSAAIQQLQFKSLCRECAPSFARVFEDERAAAWAGGAGDGD